MIRTFAIPYLRQLSKLHLSSDVGVACIMYNALGDQHYHSHCIQGTVEGLDNIMFQLCANLMLG